MIEPHISAKEICISEKEPYDSFSKETYLHANIFADFTKDDRAQDGSR